MNLNYFSFKKLFLAYTFGVMPFFVLSGMLSLFNIVPINFNDSPQYGFIGFLLSLISIPLFGLIFSILNWLLLNFGVIIHLGFSKVFKRK